MKKSRKQPRQHKQWASGNRPMPVYDCIGTKRATGVYNCVIQVDYNLSSAATGLVINNTPLYTGMTAKEPFPTLSSVFMTYEVDSVECTWVPLPISSTSLIYTLFAYVNPMGTGNPTPASTDYILNMPGVRTWSASNTSLKFAYRPKSLLKMSGHPYKFISGYTPTVQPYLVWGVRGGTTTTLLGVLRCSFHVKFTGSGVDF